MNNFPYLDCKRVLNYCFIFISVNAQLANLYSTTRMWEVYSEVGLVVVGSGVEKGETPSEKKMLFLYFQKYINCSENKDRQHIDF